MKKLIIGILGLALLCGCGPETQQKNNLTDGTKLYSRKFEFEGHQYIEFSRPGGLSYDNYTGFVHDPDCSRCEEKLKELIHNEL